MDERLSYESMNDGQKRRIDEVVAQSIEFLDSKRQASGEPKTDMSEFGRDVFPDEEIPFS